MPPRLTVSRRLWGIWMLSSGCTSKGIIGSYDAAVFDSENGKPHIVKRLDRPQARIIPETFGGGKLPRKELQEVAAELTGTRQD
jgi:hypothetical protein